MTANVHRRTPALAVSDARGLPVRQVAYLRNVADDTPAALVSHQQHDHAERLIEQWDPRLSAPALTTVYSLDGTVLKSDSVDAGWRLTLPGRAGEPLERWDERGSHWRTTFDKQLRVIAVEENGEVDVDVFTYSDASADARHNQRGQLREQKDRSSSLRSDSFALSGQPLSETRTFQDEAAFSSHSVFSPMGAVLEQTDAGGHRRRSCYGLAGQLKRADLWISGTPGWQAVLLDTQYNANDQIIEQLAGNQVRSQWTYDPADARLHTQSSRKDGGGVLQNVEYFYDRVGNITRIEDHAFQPRYFANQLIDGHRDFTYDSLYRLTSATGYDDAPPPDIPGLPQPGDPNNRLNYTQTYQYDNGGNLIELCHVRDGNSFTRQMCIDPNSNRGVRWRTGDDLPDFDTLFDRHGNQLELKQGSTLQWNARDELESVPLVTRKNSNSDAEHYRYSQGQRVFKCHEWFTDTTRHFHQVRYLPGLEIRTKDNGEELHVITLGNARCLHWVSGRPGGIENNQLRYSLKDHLGSCVMEIDQQADVISEEGYYPFGETAWMAARHEVEVRYKFIRYSGKEMDVSGLYYYGERYYAPWLQRWISADPAGDVDGLNLYGFVGNNPMSYIDTGGTTRTPSQLKDVIAEESKFLAHIPGGMSEVQSTLADLTSPKTFRIKLIKNFIYLAGRATVGFFSGYGTTGMLPSNMPGELQGLTVGNETADYASRAYSNITSQLNASILPRHSDLDVQLLHDQSSGKSASPLDRYSVAPTTWQERSENIRALFSLGRDSVGGALIPGVSELAELFQLSKDTTKAEQLLSKFELDVYDSMLDSLREGIVRSSEAINVAFNELGVEQVYTNSIDYLRDLGQGRVAASNSRMIELSAIRLSTESALRSVDQTKAVLARYRVYAAEKAVKRAA
ncbi:RHS repeat-associated core domain protein containing protein [Pseudomonas sp. GM16]|nr:RHS repeat-associated core domain-containing protein [Pseudomonas sp. GM16]EJL99746.1 RHS repeat-associated core domain protein containing protein [Pseudomonas sp. GM16]